MFVHPDLLNLSELFFPAKKRSLRISQAGVLASRHEIRLQDDTMTRNVILVSDQAKPPGPQVPVAASVRTSTISGRSALMTVSGKCLWCGNVARSGKCGVESYRKNRASGSRGVMKHTLDLIAQRQVMTIVVGPLYVPAIVIEFTRGVTGKKFSELRPASIS